MAVLFLPGVASLPAQDETPGVEIKKLTPRRKGDKKAEEVFRKLGKLTSADPSDPKRPNHYHHVYPRTFEFGKMYMIELYQAAGTHWDPYLRLEDATGSLNMQDDDSAGNLNSRIVYTPTATGEFKVYVTTLGERDTGDYELKITPLPPGTSIPGFGMPVQSYLPTEYGKIRITALPHLAQFNNQESRYGYIEYRFTIENESEKDSHTVTIALPAGNAYGGRDGPYLTSVRRTQVVGPQMSATISLFQPALPIYGAAGASVTIDGRLMQDTVSCAVVSERGNSSSRYGMTKSAGGGHVPVLTTNDVISQVGGAAYNWAQEKQKAEEIEAKVDPKADPKEPVAPGFDPTDPGPPKPPPGTPPGTPPISRPGRMPAQSPLGFIQATRATPDWSPSWLAYTPFAGIIVTGKSLDDAPFEVRTAIYRYVEAGGALLILDKAKLPPTWQPVKEYEGAVHYSPGFGQCITGDWKAWQSHKNSVAIQDMFVASHNAFGQIVSLNDAHRQFPVVENSGVPVRGLFIFMFVFVLIIGPVNIFWLARNNRRIWLLWTVPAIALVTGTMLFGYMRVTEGWYGHVRSLSVTVLDENSQRAVTASWLGYYSPATPGTGLHYSATAEMTPQNERSWNPYRGGGGDSQPVSIDWTDDQHFASGWITPRVPLHMLVRNNVKSELRVTVSESNGKPASAVNLLGVPIAKLYVAGADKMIYTADDVAPGAKINLLPGNAASKSPIPIRTGYSGRWLDFASRLENSPGSYLRPNTYIAVIDEGSPFLDDGSPTTQSRKTKAVVYGILPISK